MRTLIWVWPFFWGIPEDLHQHMIDKENQLHDDIIQEDFKEAYLNLRCALELIFRQNLHFFNQYRCYLLLFKEICMNKPNHNKFHTCIVTHLN